MQAVRPNGELHTYTLTGSQYISESDDPLQLSAASSNNGAAWKIVDPSGKMEFYDATGRIQLIQYIDGKYIAFTYAPSPDPNSPIQLDAPLVPLSASDETGRILQISSNDGKNISNIAMGGASLVSYQYAILGAMRGLAGNSSISTASYADGTERQYVYDESGSAPGGNLLGLMTSLLDESGAKYASWTYDTHGLTTSSTVGGLLTESVTRVDDGAGNISASITDPIGSVYNLTAKVILNFPRLVTRAQPAGSGCSASTQDIGYDANGNDAWQDDFVGNRTCFANDTTRNLETGRVEGLPSGTSCAGLVSPGTTLPPGARMISTQWHPSWNLKVGIAQPGKITSWIYNGQPDPSNGGALAACAPTSATLPDGSPIVVLCKEIEQATGDSNGQQGFGASPLVGASYTRIWQYTYDQYGNLLTATDSNNNTTTYTYYADTSATHTMGDLMSASNALGQVTNYPLYNQMGQVLQSVDTNQIATNYTYDARQRLTSVSKAGSTTSYAYWPTGKLQTIALPDGSSLSLGYDSAHRLTSITDGLGNQISYTLDNSGVRDLEQVTDPNGLLARQLTRAADSLGRVRMVAGQE